MKQFLLWMAVVGLATTGCAQNRVFAPQTSRAGAGLPVARSASTPRPSIRSARSEQRRGVVDLAAFGSGGSCCASGCCDSGCCDSGCCDDCCCGADGCSDGKGRRGRGCSTCGGRGCGLCRGLNPHAGGYPEAQDFNPSPATGQVAYPYYTVKGPRDFLRNNPPSMGPY